MKGEAYRESSLGGGEEEEEEKKSCMYGEEGGGGGGVGWRRGVEGFSGAVQARSAKICLMHSLNLGACAGFSQGYRRGLCREKPERETMQQQSTRNTLPTSLRSLAAFTVTNALFFSCPYMLKKSNKRKLNITFYRCSLITRLVLLRAAVAQITEAASHRL